MIKSKKRIISFPGLEQSRIFRKNVDILSGHQSMVQIQTGKPWNSTIRRFIRKGTIMIIFFFLMNQMYLKIQICILYKSVFCVNKHNKFNYCKKTCTCKDLETTLLSYFYAIKFTSAVIPSAVWTLLQHPCQESAQLLKPFHLKKHKRPSKTQNKSKELKNS